MAETFISLAGAEDIPAIVQLVNSAYRGPEAKQGWTHEADLISGNTRIDAHSLRILLGKKDAVILKYANPSLSGCVYLEKKGDHLYLGMLSVHPALQDKGIGKILLKAAEAFAQEKNCHTIEMTVIEMRKELIAWYQRNGYKDSGIRKPFIEDERFGVPAVPLHFIVMTKSLPAPHLS